VYSSNITYKTVAIAFLEVEEDRVFQL